MELDLDIGYAHNVFYRNVKFNLPDQGIISFIGDNGSGKSTIYKTLIGIIPPMRGKVPDEIINRTAIISDYIHIPEENKVKDIIKLNAYYENECERSNLLYDYISQHLDQKVKNLSSGQKRILEIFLVFLSGKNIIILDEATNALDFKNKQMFLDCVKEFSKSGVLFIHTSHDLSEIIFLNSSPYLLVKGKGKIIQLINKQKNTEELAAWIKKEGELT